MKIWIDFINSPQVSFFEPLINELSNSGHEFVLTCRDSSNTVQLIKQKHWPHHIVGDRAEKGFLKKLFVFPLRVNSLYQYLKHKKVDVAIGQSSFYLPITAKILGVPSIYSNDNEHALGNTPSFLFATKILVPESLSIKKIVKQGAKRSKITQYPGVKEGVYLWGKGQLIKKMRESGEKPLKNIYIRPEPSTAQYYSGKTNFLDDLIIGLKECFNVIVLVRDHCQSVHYDQHKFFGVSVPKSPIAFEEVAAHCLLFIGAGGSMTREMALMGIPTISVYQGKLLDVDKFLISQNLMSHQPNINTEFVKKFLSNSNSTAMDAPLIVKGREAYEQFKFTLLTYQNDKSRYNRIR